MSTASRQAADGLSSTRVDFDAGVALWDSAVAPAGRCHRPARRPDAAPLRDCRIGVLISGRRLRDDECLDAAEAIETRLGIETPIDPK